MANNSSRKTWRSSFLALLCLGILGLVPTSARAQATPTVVTATVLDVNGVAYYPATVTVSYTAGSPGQPAITPCTNPSGSCPFAGPPSPTTTTSAGSWVQNVIPNGNITTGGTYSFSVSTPGSPPPLGSGPQTCTLNNQTIAGASQTLSFTGCPALGGTGSSSPSANTPNLNGVYVTTKCPAGEVNCFQWNPDVVQSGNVTFTQNSATITSTDALWLPSDAGKQFQGLYGPSHVSLFPTANGLTTISTVNSATSITVHDAVIGGIGTYTGFGTWWTADQTFVFQAANAYALSIVASNQSMYPPNSRATLWSRGYRPTIYVSPGFAHVRSVILSELESNTNTMGIGLVGSGRTATQFFVGPDWSFTASGGCGLICESNVFGSIYKDFAVNGGGDGFGFNLTGTMTVVGFVECTQCTRPLMENVSMVGPGTPLSTQSLVEFDSTSGGVTVDNSEFAGNFVGFSFICNFCSGRVTDTYYGNSNQSSLWENTGGQDTENSPFVLDNNTGDECGAIATACHVSQGSNLSIRSGVHFGEFPAWSCDATSVLHTSAGANIGAFNSANNGSAITFASGCKVFSEDSMWRGNGTGAVFSGPGSGSGSFFDGGNNSYFNCVAGNICNPTNNIITGNVNIFGSASITGTLQTSGNITLSAGWGTGAAPSAVSGATNVFTFTVTAGTTPAAGPTITATFPRAYPATPICRLQETNTNDIITDPLTTTVSATAVTYTMPASFTPTSTKTYTFTSTCGLNQ